MLARVSNLESFRQWKDSEDLGVGWLIDRIFGDSPSPAMLAGTAFHKAIETVDYAEFENLSANGYTFQFNCDCEIEVAKIRELRGFRKYGDLTVSGQCDCLIGKTIVDHKTTSQFDPDRFMFGYQWRYYLDIFEADVFRWNVFEISEADDPMSYVVKNYHRLEQMRYPEMHDDCAKLAQEFEEFAKVHLVGYVAPTLESQLQASIDRQQAPAR
jgi:hypothetical protein